MDDVDIAIDSLEPDRLPDEPAPEETRPDESAEAAAAAGGETEDTAASDDDQTDGDDTAADDQKPKKAKGVQKRIDELTANWRNAERQAEHWRQMAMREGQQPKPQDQPQATAPSAPKPEDFQNYDDYLVARAKHETRLEIQAEMRAQQEQREQAEREARARDIRQSFAERTEKARERYDDFDAVAFSDQVQISAEMAQAIAESDLGPDIAYHLGSHPDEARRIASLSPLAQARELGRIEASLISKAEAPRPRTTAAPNPPRTVKASDVPSKDPSKMTNAEYAAWRTGQR